MIWIWGLLGLWVVTLGCAAWIVRGLLIRLASLERMTDAVVQRFAEAGIDVTVTHPLQTQVLLPERWIGEDEFPIETAATVRRDDWFSE